MLPSIAIHGLKGVGKDTVGHYLRRQHGYISIAIADLLKSYLEEVNPLVIRDRDSKAVPLGTLLAENSGDWGVSKRKNPHIEETLKQYGHGARTVFGDDFWVFEFLKAYERFEAHFYDGVSQAAVITDIRYENELAMIKEFFQPLVSIKLVRPGHISDGHPSEDGLPDAMFDALIENTGTLKELYHSVDHIISIHVAAAEREA